MEEPLALFVEPKDEPERRALDPGSFTGIEVALARQSLEDESAGLVVKRIVENSPADSAGLEVDDILLFVVDAQGREHVLGWPSEWRNLELSTEPGSEVTVVYDRAGVEREARIVTIPRVRAPERQAAERYREETRVGVVLRTATEVEARAGGLGPGGGAVVVGLSLESPFREAGLRYRDLIIAVDGKDVDHPQVVLNAIRDGEEAIEVQFVRHGEKRTVESPLSRRESEMTMAYVPILFDYESGRGNSELSLLLGLIRYQSTPAAWEFRLLWLIKFRGGDANRLEEVSER
jgi:C-terminal processing protease CtpA/Prc